MAKQRDPKVYLFDILDSAKNILEFTKEINVEKFEADLLVCSAVKHQIMVIGEAVKKVPGYLKYQYPDIPWRAMAGMRDILVHQYHNAKPEKVWEVVANEIPSIIKRVEKILNDLEN
jgi:uncharacterized protein with HEPN domain